MRKGKGLNSGGVASSFLICLAASAVLIVLLSVVSAFIANALDNPTESIGILSLSTLLLSAVLGGIICSRINAEGGLRFAALVALAVVLVILFINVIITSGKVTAGAFMNYGCYLGLYSLSAFVFKKKKGHRRHK